MYVSRFSKRRVGDKGMTIGSKVKTSPLPTAQYFGLRWYLLGMLGILQVIVVMKRIISERYEFWRYDAKLQEYVIVKGTADYLSKLLEGIAPLLFIVFLIAASIYPIHQFLRYYAGAKTIYTMLRLPQKRVYLYLSILGEVIQITVIAWLAQLILLFLYYGLYRLLIPQVCQPMELWGNLWNQGLIQFFYPVGSFITWIRPISFILYLPSVMFLSVIFVKCERGRILGVGVVLLSVLGMVISFRYLELSVFIGPMVTLLVIGSGIYYVSKKAIV